MFSDSRWSLVLGASILAHSQHFEPRLPSAETRVSQFVVRMGAKNCGQSVGSYQMVDTEGACVITLPSFLG